MKIAGMTWGEIGTYVTTIIVVPLLLLALLQGFAIWQWKRVAIGCVNQQAEMVEEVEMMKQAGKLCIFELTQCRLDNAKDEE